jgi:hypothetical protein
MKSILISLAVLASFAAVSQAWPWSDKELKNADPSKLEQLANRVLIKSERGKKRMNAKLSLLFYV